MGSHRYLTIFIAFCLWCILPLSKQVYILISVFMVALEYIPTVNNDNRLCLDNLTCTGLRFTISFLFNVRTCLGSLSSPHHGGHIRFGLGLVSWCSNIPCLPSNEQESTIPWLQLFRGWLKTWSNLFADLMFPIYVTSNQRRILLLWQWQQWKNTLSQAIKKNTIIYVLCILIVESSHLHISLQNWEKSLISLFLDSWRT